MSRLPVPIARILLIFLALATPALAQDAPRSTAAAREAAMDFRVYVDGVRRKGERPDLTRPEVAAMLGRVFDLEALNALPPVKGSDLEWLLDWTEAANTVNKLITRYGSKPGPQPDLEALQRNMTEYEDQYAAAMNFLIRSQAREAVSMRMFWDGLAPAQRTRIRADGFTGARRGMAEFVLAAICSTVESGGKPANARLVTAAVRDTREIWANHFLPQDRTRLVEYIAGHDKQVPDEATRADLAAFTEALQAVD
ncbi:hypothetical protein [Bradyrhizobium erythrophlei]|jgi:hypothetical protein|uniref:Uncharacterized protein n=1 Tax=Bradyrhizobium erythrophlei TaxID=1437360 RepID=A0A1M7U213_9BRAD|nr:hypothetical protein [Bradyrhizobium erythrophlei]SHN76890.1 hypothetical protein SAMN05444170_3330 [Bradyrhizobium erythrophlei]